METEKRLIDADEFMEHHCNGCPYRGEGSCTEDDPICATIQDLKDFPTVDAVEVVHGYMVERIVDHECPWYTVYDCSECGCSVEIWHNYCPNCGAKMDGDGNG
jgi:hypothetical protein